MKSGKRTPELSFQADSLSGQGLTASGADSLKTAAQGPSGRHGWRRKGEHKSDPFREEGAANLTGVRGEGSMLSASDHLWPPLKMRSDLDALDLRRHIDGPLGLEFHACFDIVDDFSVEDPA